MAPRSLTSRKALKLSWAELPLPIGLTGNTLCSRRQGGPVVAVIVNFALTADRFDDFRAVIVNYCIMASIWSMSVVAALAWAGRA